MALLTGDSSLFFILFVVETICNLVLAEVISQNLMKCILYPESFYKP